jgi:hypothetical protein
MKFSDFLFESIWQVITWVCICVTGGFFVSYCIKGQGQGRGIMWSGIFLSIFTLLMIGMVADRIFFQVSEKQRPYISISAIGVPGIVLQPGPLTIWCEIKNSLAGPQISIVEANISTWFETNDRPLPKKAEYVPAPHKLSGVTIAPGDIFRASYSGDLELKESDIKLIREGAIKLYVYGFVKFRGTTKTEYCKGFIGFYDPNGQQQFGMFQYIENPSYNYDN